MRGLVAALCAVLVVLSACTGSEPGDESVSPQVSQTASPGDAVGSMTIADVLRSDPRFSWFRAITERVQTPIADSALAVWDLPASELGDDQDGVTLFVPTDAAFEALDPSVLAIIEDPEVDDDLLYGLFGHHYVHRLYPSTAFDPGDQRTWRSSASGPVQLVLEPLTWGGHPIVQTDIRAANGIIHVVDGVVIPDELAAAATGQP